MSLLRFHLYKPVLTSGTPFYAGLKKVAYIKMAIGLFNLRFKYVVRFISCRRSVKSYDIFIYILPEKFRVSQRVDIQRSQGRLRGFLGL